MRTLKEAAIEYMWASRPSGACRSAWLRAGPQGCRFSVPAGPLSNGRTLQEHARSSVRQQARSVLLFFTRSTDGAILRDPARARLDWSQLENKERQSRYSG